MGSEKPDSLSEGISKPTTPQISPTSPFDDAPDPNIVDWDGPNDPENPVNWPATKRTVHIALVSLLTLIVNLAATLFAPALGIFAESFAITNSSVASLTVSIYLLGLAIGPLIIAPLSEVYGRLPVVHASNIIFLALTIGCACSKDLGVFLFCRLAAGCAGAAPVTVGGGIVADVTTVHKRGRAMASVALGPLLGPVVGPVVGGFVAQYLGWRWTFWIVCILSGTSAIACAALLRESYGPVLLSRKASRLQKETGNPDLRPKGVSTASSPRVLLLRATIRPTKLLLLSPILSSLSVFGAFVTGLIFLLFTTFSSVFEQTYGFSAGTSGLSYLGMGFGMLVGMVAFGKVSDRILKKQEEKKKEGKGNGIRPEHRLIPMMWLCPILPIGFFWYGWSTENRVHWIVPIIGTAFIGLGAIFVILPTQTYLVDMFGPQAAASALAANLLLRSLLGAFLPMAGPKLYETLGMGWGNSLLGFLALGFAPMPVLFYRYGQVLRERFVVPL